MNADPVVVAVAAVAVGAFVLFLFVLFFHLRFWIQARLTDTPLSLFEIIGMRLRGCPPGRLVSAMVVLNLRGVKVSAREAEGYYRAALDRGEPVGTATELVKLIERLKRDNPDPPQT
jgi:uncharacterized protein YqfA (UPF0365 family)